MFATICFTIRKFTFILMYVHTYMLTRVVVFYLNNRFGGAFTERKKEKYLIKPGMWIRIWIRIRLDPYSFASLDPDPNSQYGSGSRGIKQG